LMPTVFWRFTDADVAGVVGENEAIFVFVYPVYKAQRLPLQASFSGSGDILTYLVVLAIEAWPISFDSRQASMPPLACIVPVVCRRQCGCTGQVIPAFCPAVPIILLMANRVKASPRSLVKIWGRLGSCSRCSRLRPLASSRSR